MGDLATHSASYPLENGQISSFTVNSLEMDERLFSNYSSQENAAFYEDRENGDDDILNNYDFLHWPELGKHMTNVPRIKHEVEAQEVSDLLEQESTYPFHEDSERLKIGCSSDSKPQTYASVLQKTLKLKIDNEKTRMQVGNHVTKSDAEDMLYTNSKDNTNIALVFGDQKYIFEWNFIDLSPGISDSYTRQEAEHLSQIYSDFMRNALETYPQGKEFLEFSTLLTLVGSRIEMQEIDGITQLYYCLNKGWTEEDSESAHKSYLPHHWVHFDSYGETDSCQEVEIDILSAKAQAVCTYGFDLNTALSISKDLWDSNKPRMAYTQMFNVG